MPIIPATLDELAKGRPVKPCPYKYDTFNSIEDMEEYLSLTTQVLKII
jgi:hypothetical protein